jgi:hypothetical protein
MHRGHEAMLDADGVVQDLCDRREAVRGAGRVRNHDMVARQLLMVDAIDDGQIDAVGGGRNQHALGARRQMRRCALLRGEDAGAFERNIDAQFLMRQLGRVPNRRHLQILAVHDHTVARNLHLGGKAAMYRIVAQQMRIGLGWSQIVDGDDLKVFAPGFDDATQHQAPNASETVDRDTNGHD